MLSEEFVSRGGVNSVGPGGVNFESSAVGGVPPTRKDVKKELQDMRLIYGCTKQRGAPETPMLLKAGHPFPHYLKQVNHEKRSALLHIVFLCFHQPNPSLSVKDLGSFMPRPLHNGEVVVSVALSANHLVAI